jgi:aryl carrier-like protein
MQECPGTVAIEKFATTDLSTLREDLLRSGLDSRQVAELVRSFLAERGYGVLLDDVHKAAPSFFLWSGSLQRMQEALESLAVPM